MVDFDFGMNGNKLVYNVEKNDPLNNIEKI